MNIKVYCLSLPQVVETYPFDEKTCVMKVNNRMFALINNKNEISLKCEPMLALAYRDMFEAVRPGYHLNKEHWNTVAVGQDVDEELLKKMIKESYKAVVSKFPKKEQGYYLNLLEEM